MWNNVQLDPWRSVLPLVPLSPLHVGTDRGCVQLGPRDVHSCFSPSLRVSCSRDTAELVRAGLDTEPPSAGPPVVFTIWTHTHQTKHWSWSQSAQTRADGEHLRTASERVWNQKLWLVSCPSLLWLVNRSDMSRPLATLCMYIVLER